MAFHKKGENTQVMKFVSRKHCSIGVLLCMALAAPTAMAGHHEPVLQVVSVDVKPGMLSKYLKQVGKLNGILADVESKATVRVWRAAQAGENTGTVLVALEYPNAEAWAAAAPKIQANEDWQDIIGDLDELRTLNSSAMWTDISTNQSDGSPGAVMVVTGVTVNPGMLATYQERVGQGAAMNERLSLSGRMRMWQATLAGPATGNVAVAIEYKDLATYAAENAKISGDAEWQSLLSGLNDIRTLNTRSLYQEITP